MEESQILFKMGNVDYTRFITMGSYDVNSLPVTKDYTDILNRDHKQYIRDKISGSFTLKFYDDCSYPDVETTKSAVENYLDFFSAYEENREPNGLITITLYSNNKNTTKEIQAYMEMKPKNELPYMNGGNKSYSGFDVTVNEK